MHPGKALNTREFSGFDGLHAEKHKRRISTPHDWGKKTGCGERPGAEKKLFKPQATILAECLFFDAGSPSGARVTTGYTTPRTRRKSRSSDD